MLPRLIPNWRQSWRFHSIRAAAVLAALSLAQADLLPQVQPIVPAKYWPYVTFGFAAAIWVFRIVAQHQLHDGDQQEPSK